MAQNNQSSEIRSRIVKGMWLNESEQGVPSRVAESIVPTFQSNIPVPYIREISALTSNNDPQNLTVPENKTWKILYGRVELITDANVANRRVFLQIFDDVGTKIWENQAGAVQTASTTENYYLKIGSGTSAEPNAGFHELYIPSNCYLPSGFVFRIDIDNFQATDQTKVYLIIEEYEYSLR